MLYSVELAACEGSRGTSMHPPISPLIALSIVHALGHAAREKTLFIATSLQLHAHTILSETRHSVEGRRMYHK